MKVWPPLCLNEAESMCNKCLYGDQVGPFSSDPRWTSL